MRFGILIVATVVAGLGRAQAQVAHQNPPAHRRQAGGQIHRGGGFSHSPFLIGDGDDFDWHAWDLASSRTQSEKKIGTAPRPKALRHLLLLP